MTKEQQVKAILLPLANRVMIIANANVAEIVLSLDVEKHKSKKEWLLGSAHWRGFEIPVVSIEQMGAKNITIDKSKTSYIVLYALNSKNKYAYYAIAVNGIPRLKFVDKEKLKEIKSDSLGEYFVAEIEVDEERFSIPDLAKIEALIEKG